MVIAMTQFEILPDAELGKMIAKGVALYRVQYNALTPYRDYKSKEWDQTLILMRTNIILGLMSKTSGYEMQPKQAEDNANLVIQGILQGLAKQKEQVNS
jgi:hypothetical protein